MLMVPPSLKLRVEKLLLYFLYLPGSFRSAQFEGVGQGVVFGSFSSTPEPSVCFCFYPAGGALAHAFFPCRGEAHFDMAERWTLNGYKGHNLFMVIAHEVGHTLGLEHSPVRHALMSPYYKKLGKATVLSWDDITAVQQFYGGSAYSTLREEQAIKK